MVERELLLDVGVPVIPRAADAAGVRQFMFEGISRPHQATMAGSAMHVPSVGAILLVAMAFARPIHE